MVSNGMAAILPKIESNLIPAAFVHCNECKIIIIIECVCSLHLRLTSNRQINGNKTKISTKVPIFRILHQH